MKKYIFLVLIIPVFFGIMLPKVHASYKCTTLTTSTKITVPNISIPHDLPVGSPIGPEIRSNEVLGYKCSGRKVSRQDFGIRFPYSHSSLMIDGRFIYATSVAGIGYAVGMQDTSSAPCPKKTAFLDGTNSLAPNLPIRSVCSINGLFTKGDWKGVFIIQLYKTAEKIGSGPITTMNLPYTSAFVLMTDGVEALPEATFTINPIPIKTLGCTINSSTVSVPLGNVNRPMFKGPGTWPGDTNTRDFAIPLTCEAGTRVNLKIDGNIQNAAQGVLNLTSVTGSASGIGVQLLYDNKPLPLSTTIETGETSSTGVYNIPLKARYYQTDNNISAGIANSSATFTLTYQ